MSQGIERTRHGQHGAGRLFGIKPTKASTTQHCRGILSTWIKIITWLEFGQGNRAKQPRGSEKPFQLFHEHLAGKSLALHLSPKMLLTTTSCHTTLQRAGSLAGLSLLLQIWVELGLDRDIFKVRKNNTSVKAALSPVQQLRSDTWGADHAALQ